MALVAEHIVLGFTMNLEQHPWSVGSVGRAHRSHRWGHWFESSTDHHHSAWKLAVNILVVSEIQESSAITPAFTVASALLFYAVLLQPSDFLYLYGIFWTVDVAGCEMSRYNGLI